MKKSTLILLAVVVVLGIVAYSLSRGPASDELRRQRTQLLPHLDSDKVIGLAIESDDARILCRRREGEEWDLADWDIVEPIQTRAESWRVRNVVNRL
ncbi:MAG: hypothetical protein R6V05_10825, partial [Candidatus Brocadiia bacterium]